MQIYNCDETGVTIVFKPGKVMAELWRRNVYAVSAAEKGQTHTILFVFLLVAFLYPNNDLSSQKTCSFVSKGGSIS